MSFGTNVCNYNRAFLPLSSLLNQPTSATSSAYLNKLKYESWILNSFVYNEKK